MYEVLIAGGPSDGRIIGEFKDLVDAYDMVTAFAASDHHPDEAPAILMNGGVLIDCCRKD